MPAPTPLCKTILRNVRDADNASAGAGETLLQSYRQVVGQAIANNGRVMNSTSSGGKAYSFMLGINLDRLVDAMDEAEGIWKSYTSDMLVALLDVRPARTVQAHFGGAYQGRCNIANN